MVIFFSKKSLILFQWLFQLFVRIEKTFSFTTNFSKDFIKKFKIMKDISIIEEACSSKGYIYLEEIGFGMNGSVHTIFCPKYQKQFVVKRIPTKKGDFNKISLEYKVLMGLDHPNIIKMYDFWFDEIGRASCRERVSDPV